MDSTGLAGYAPGYFRLGYDETIPQNDDDTRINAARPTLTAASLAHDFVMRSANLIEDTQDTTNYDQRPSASNIAAVWMSGARPNLATDTQTTPQASVLLAWFTARLKRIQNALPGAP